MGFDVEPKELGGYAEMLDALGDPLTEAKDHLNAHVQVYALTGILGGAVAEALDKECSEIGLHVSNAAFSLGDTAGKLRLSAWQYAKDETNAEIKFKPNRPGDPEPLPDSVKYPLDHYPKLPKPESARASLEEVAGDIDGITGIVDAILSVAADKSALTIIISDVLCDWQILDRAGIALEDAGNRVDHVKADMEQGLAKVLQHWKGGAADTFAAHMERRIAGLGDIAASARIIGEAYQIGALLIEMAAKRLVSGINKVVVNLVGDSFFSVVIKGLKRLIPVIGQLLTANDAKNAVRVIGQLVTSIETFLRDVVNKLTEMQFAKMVGKESAERVVGTVDSLAETAVKFGEGAVIAADKAWDAVEMRRDAERLATSPNDIEKMPEWGDYQGAGATKSERSRESK
ncbi:hypothetical protein EV193_10178 [Herbihabitans rhizosphaerae]|uniref:Excreted virulence factor EspC (Type VII ESX diderm) n=1 Tax=Herbihabitans rhizosphaerae TaxID=1872711 RepID=A0A4V2EUD6_9PSEU|nr:hypothetical protein [Herbihabitans rhizosphaerae]RZS44203.1 hypothetical protein EV193_10178 [Herbihabitans rhizosphaerae]